MFFSMNVSEQYWHKPSLSRIELSYVLEFQNAMSEVAMFAAQMETVVLIVLHGSGWTERHVQVCTGVCQSCIIYLDRLFRMFLA